MVSTIGTRLVIWVTGLESFRTYVGTNTLSAVR